MKQFFTFSLAILFVVSAYAQMYIPITNNMVINSYSNIKFVAGNYIFSDTPADGVALYHCDSINIHDNDFSWNTSYVIRMFWTDSSMDYNTS